MLSDENQTEDEKGLKISQDVKIGRIRGLIKEQLDPFLDTFGTPYCIVSGSSNKAIFPLNGIDVRSLLFYEYEKTYGSYPTWMVIEKAIYAVRGQLIRESKIRAYSNSDPLLLKIVAAMKKTEFWHMSAGEILNALRRINYDDPQLRTNADLPKNADAMGIWLRTNTPVLSAHGIEVIRPNRTAKKRLWSLRLIVRKNDSGDTFETEVSSNVSAPKLQETSGSTNNDTSDTCRDESELLAILTQGDTVR